MDGEQTLGLGEMSLWKFFGSLLQAIGCWAIALLDVITSHEFATIVPYFYDVIISTFQYFKWGLIFSGAIILIIPLTQYVLYTLKVTNKRIICEYGLFVRKSTEIRLSKVESVTVEVSLIGSILNFGKVIVTGSGGTPAVFPWLRNPYKFRDIIQHALEKEKADK